MRICGCNDKGRHRGICAMSINNNPLPITQGVPTVPTQAIDPAIIAALANNPDALNAYMAQFNTVPNTVPSNVPATPVQPVQPVVQLQDEYVVPLAKPVHKTNGFSVFTDRRGYDTNFKNTPNTVRITKIYADPALLNGYDQWELVLRKVK